MHDCMAQNIRSKSFPNRSFKVQYTIGMSNHIRQMEVMTNFPLSFLCFHSPVIVLSPYMPTNRLQSFLHNLVIRTTSGNGKITHSTGDSQ